MLGGLFNTEKIVSDTIQTTLENISEELNCSFKDFFVMIKPTDENFKMAFYVYRIGENGAPQFVRQISLAEILGNE